MAKHPPNSMPLVRITPACRCRVAWLAVFAWAATIYWFSAQSGVEIERMNFLELWDKAAHFTIFAVGAVPMTLALRWSFRWTPLVVLGVSIVALALYGGADEIHQTYTPGRSGADLTDWIADVLGSVVGSFFMYRFHARTQRPHRPAPARD